MGLKRSPLKLNRSQRPNVISSHNPSRHCEPRSCRSEIVLARNLGLFGNLVFLCVAAAALLWVMSVAAGAEVLGPEVVWAPARVADASDRAYEPVAIGLIDQAKESVALSIYLVRESEDARHPVNRLLNDLLEAARRGVRIEIYLNTRFKGSTPEKILETPALNRLKEAGAQVTGLPANRRLHDKLLIVDERWILEGSTNWSVEALKMNWESNTLIDSPSLAKQKLHRLRQMSAGPKEVIPAVRERHPPPKTLDIPTAWIARGSVLPRMVSSRDERAFDTLLLLMREAAAQSSPEFFVNLEELALDAGIPEHWDDTATRRQMLKVLRKLHDDPAAGVDINFTHGKDAWVKLVLPAEPVVKVSSGLIEPALLAATPAAVTYLNLFDLVLQQQEGVGIHQLTLRELAQRTGLSAQLLRRARNGT